MKKRIFVLFLGILFLCPTVSLLASETGSVNSALMLNPIYIPVSIYKDNLTSPMIRHGSACSVEFAQNAWSGALDSWNNNEWMHCITCRISFVIGMSRDEFEEVLVFFSSITGYKARVIVDLSEYDIDDYESAHLVVKPTGWGEAPRYEYYNEQGWIKDKYNFLKNITSELGKVWISTEFYASAYTPSQPSTPPVEGGRGKGWLGNFYIALMPKMSGGKMGSTDDPNVSIALDPINITNGNLYSIHQDISISSKGLPLELTRTYNSRDEYNGAIGYGWTYNYNVFLNDSEGYYVGIKGGEGARTFYVRKGDGTYSSSAGEYSVLVKNADGTYTLTKKHGTKYNFDSNGKLTSIADRNNNTQTLSYTGDLLTQITDYSGKSLSISYNADNRISTVTDTAGKEVAYDYDADGNLTSVTDPDGNMETYSYDENHNLITITDPEGNGSHFTYDTENDRCLSFSYDNDINKVTLNYDPENKKTTVTDSKGNASIYEYNYDWVVTKITDPEGNERSWTWDENINRTSSTDANGNTTLFEYDDRGNLTKIKDSKGSETAFAYESDFDMCASITDALTQATTYAYDEKGNLTHVENASGDSTIYTYDLSGSLLSTKDANSHTTQYEYDSHGNLVKVVDPLNNETQFEYDVSGNCTKLTDAKGNQTKYTYDILNRLTQITYPDDSAVKYAYDKVSNRTSITDPLNRITNYSYDPANKLLEVIDALQNKTTYAYDTEGNRTSVEDASDNVTAYEYDSLNRLVKSITPSGQETVYSYDAAGNRTGMTDAKGNTTIYEYDENNRLIKIAYADGKEVAFIYDELGRRTSMTDPTGTTTYEYDNLNRIVSVGTGLAPVHYVHYTYDAVGNRISMIDQNGGITTYGYDELNRLTSVIANGSEAISYSYDTVSNLTNMTLPNNTQVNYQFDNLNRLLNLTNKKNAGDVISSFGYEYNLAGMRNKVTLADGSYVNYSYDDVNRLTEEAKYSSSGNISYADAYEFDAVGNRLSKTNDLYGETTYTYNSENQLITESGLKQATQPKTVTIEGTVADASGIKSVTVNGVAAIVSANTWSAQIELQLGENTVTVEAIDKAGNKAEKSITLKLVAMRSIAYSYDDNGNLVSKVSGANTTDYSWDNENRLTVVRYQDGTEDAYTYDGAGKRIRTSEDGNVTKYLYDGLNVIIEQDNSGVTTAKYVRGLGYGGGIGGIISTTRNQAIRYYLYDGRGDVVGLTDPQGILVQSYQYDAYGNILSSTGSETNPYQFSTKEFSSRSNLIHFGARTYDPMTGRFISKDPLGMIDGPNLYAYVNNNPINLIDPYGLCAESTTKRQEPPLSQQVKPQAPSPSAAFWGGFKGSLADQLEWATHLGKAGVSPMAQAKALGKGYYRAEQALVGIAIGASVGAGVGELAILVATNKTIMLAVTARLLELQAGQLPPISQAEIWRMISNQTRTVIEMVIK